jgi:hypothetical protein
MWLGGIYNSQATNRKEGGLTMSAVYKLLGGPTTGAGECLDRVWGLRELKKQISPQAT